MAIIKNDPYRVFDNLASREETTFLRKQEAQLLKNYPGLPNQIAEFLYLKLRLFRLIKESEAARIKAQEKMKRKEEHVCFVEKLTPLIHGMEMFIETFQKRVGIEHEPEKIYPKKLRTFQETPIQEQIDWLDKFEKFLPSFEGHVDYCFGAEDENKRKASEEKLNILAEQIFN